MDWRKNVYSRLNNIEYSSKVSLMWNTFLLYFGNFNKEVNKEDLIGSDEYVVKKIDDYLKDLSDIKKALDYRNYKKWILNSKECIPEVDNKNMDAFFTHIPRYIESLFGQQYERAMYDAIKANESDEYHFFYEIIQNADDCSYSNIEQERKQFELIKKSDNKLLFKYNEDGMTRSDVIAFCSLYDSNKNVGKNENTSENSENTPKQQIGEKGQGFKTVFKVAEKVEVRSGNYHFIMEAQSTSTGQDAGIKLTSKALNEGELEDYEGTQLLLTLWTEKKDFHNVYNANEILEKMQEQFFGFAGENGGKQNMFEKCPILFTRNISCLKIGEHELKKEEETGEKLCKGRICYGNGDINIEYFRYIENITFGKLECDSRYGEYSKDKVKDIQIIVPYKKDENENILIDGDIEKGTLYSFLPTERKVNVPMNIHIPAFLEENRTDIKSETNGSSTVRWNEHIIESLLGISLTSGNENITKKGVIQNFLELICQKVEQKELIKLIPTGSLFDDEAAITKILNDKKIEDICFKNAKIFKSIADDGKYVSGCEAFVFDSDIKKLGIEKVYYSKMSEYENIHDILKQKQWIFYADGIDEIRAKCGISVCEEISNYDKEKIEIINQIYSSDDKRMDLWNEKKNGDILVSSKSNYLPDMDGKKQLKIYPYYTKIQETPEIKYTAYQDDDLWIISNCTNQMDLSELSVVRFWAGKCCINENTSFEITKLEDNDGKIQIKNVMERISKQDWKKFYEVCLYLSKRFYQNDNWVQFVKECQEEYINGIINKLKQLNIEIKDNTELTVRQSLIALQIKNKNKMSLPGCIYWNKDICDALNEIGFFENLGIEVSEKNNESDKNNESNIKTQLCENYFAGFKLEIKSIFIRPLGCSVACVCFGQKIIVNCNSAEYKENRILPEIAKHISEGTATAVQNKNQVELIRGTLEKETLLPLLSNEGKNCIENAMVCAELIQKITLVDALNTANGIVRQEKQDSSSYGDNDIAYELLQNVNDCKIRSKKRNKTFDGKNVNTGNDLDITISENEIKLEYVEAGFTAVDLLAICTLENTGNYNSEDSTGHKGTGFKCIYRVSDNVVIESGYFKVKFRLNEHPAYDMNLRNSTIEINKNGAKTDEDGIIWEKWNKDKPKPKYPVPGFSFTEEKKEITSLTLTKKEGADVEFDKVVAHLKDSLSYLFLSKIRKIGFCEKKGEEEKTWNIEITMQDGEKEIKNDLGNTIAYCSKMEVSFGNPDKRLHIKFDRYVQNVESPFEVLFPEAKIKEEHSMYYCDLPMVELNDRYGYGFIVNMSHRIEPDDNRKAYAIDTEDNRKIKVEEKTWFKDIFKHYAATKGYSKALEFYPHNLGTDDNRYDYEGIEKVEFLPAKTIDENQDFKCSIQSLLPNGTTYILDKVMKKWCSLLEREDDCKKKLKEELGGNANAYLNIEEEPDSIKVLNVSTLNSLEPSGGSSYFESFENKKIKTLLKDKDNKFNQFFEKLVRSDGAGDIPYKVSAVIWLEVAGLDENDNWIKDKGIQKKIPEKLKDVSGYRFISQYKYDLKEKYSEQGKSNLTDEDIEKIIEKVILENPETKKINSVYEEDKYTFVKNCIKCIEDEDDNIQKEVLEFFYDLQQEHYKNLWNSIQNDIRSGKLQSQEIIKNVYQRPRKFIDDLLNEGIFIQKRLLPSNSCIQNPYVVVQCKEDENKKEILVDLSNKKCYWTYTNGINFSDKGGAVLDPNQEIKISSEKYNIFEFRCQYSQLWEYDDVLKICKIGESCFEICDAGLKQGSLEWIEEDSELQKSLVTKMLWVLDRKLQNFPDDKKTYSESYKTFLENMSCFCASNSNRTRKEIFEILLREHKKINEQFDNQINWTWDWCNKFYYLIDIYNDYYRNPENTKGRFWFEFKNDGIRRLSRQEKINIYQKLPNSIKEKNFNKFESEQSMEIGTLLENRVYIRDCSEKNQSKYIYANRIKDNKETENIIVVMGNHSLRKFLREECGYSGYGEPKRINEMVSFPEDELEENKFNDNCCNIAEVFSNIKEKKVLEQLEKLESMEDEEAFKNQLSVRYDIENKGVFYSFRGYGKTEREKDTPKCPICQAPLTAELNSIHIRWLNISQLSEEQNDINYIVAPFIMCGNCVDAFEASTNVSVYQCAKTVEVSGNDLSESDNENRTASVRTLTTDYLLNNNQVEVQFSRNGGFVSVTHIAELTVLHRKIIYDILERETKK